MYNYKTIYYLLFDEGMRDDIGDTKDNAIKGMKHLFNEIVITSYTSKIKKGDIDFVLDNLTYKIDKDKENNFILGSLKNHAITFYLKKVDNNFDFYYINTGKGSEYMDKKVIDDELRIQIYKREINNENIIQLINIILDNIKTYSITKDDDKKETFINGLYNSLLFPILQGQDPNTLKIDEGGFLESQNDDSDDNYIPAQIAGSCSFHSLYYLIYCYLKINKGVNYKEWETFTENVKIEAGYYFKDQILNYENNLVLYPYLYYVYGIDTIIDYKEKLKWGDPYRFTDNKLLFNEEIKNYNEIIISVSANQRERYWKNTFALIIYIFYNYDRIINGFTDEQIEIFNKNLFYLYSEYLSDFNVEKDIKELKLESSYYEYVYIGINKIINKISESLELESKYIKVILPKLEPEINNDNYYKEISYGTLKNRLNINNNFVDIFIDRILSLTNNISIINKQKSILLHDILHNTNHNDSLEFTEKNIIFTILENSNVIINSFIEKIDSLLNNTINQRLDIIKALITLTYYKKSPIELLKKTLDKFKDKFSEVELNIFNNFVLIIENKYDDIDTDIFYYIDIVNKENDLYYLVFDLFFLYSMKINFQNVDLSYFGKNLLYDEINPKLDLINIKIMGNFDKLKYDYVKKFSEDIKITKENYFNINKIHIGSLYSNLNQNIGNDFYINDQFKYFYKGKIELEIFNIYSEYFKLFKNNDKIMGFPVKFTKLKYPYQNLNFSFYKNSSDENYNFEYTNSNLPYEPFGNDGNIFFTKPIEINENVLSKFNTVVFLKENSVNYYWIIDLESDLKFKYNLDNNKLYYQDYEIINDTNNPYYKWVLNMQSHWLLKKGTEYSILGSIKKNELYLSSNNFFKFDRNKINKLFNILYRENNYLLKIHYSNQYLLFNSDLYYYLVNLIFYEREDLIFNIYNLISQININNEDKYEANYENSVDNISSDVIFSNNNLEKTFKLLTDKDSITYFLKNRIIKKEFNINYNNLPIFIDSFKIISYSNIKNNLNSYIPERLILKNNDNNDLLNILKPEMTPFLKIFNILKSILYTENVKESDSENLVSEIGKYFTYDSSIFYFDYDSSIYIKNRSIPNNIDYGSVNKILYPININKIDEINFNDYPFLKCNSLVNPKVNSLFKNLIKDFKDYKCNYSKLDEISKFIELNIEEIEERINDKLKEFNSYNYLLNFINYDNLYEYTYIDLFEFKNDYILLNLYNETNKLLELYKKNESKEILYQLNIIKYQIENLNNKTFHQNVFEYIFGYSFRKEQLEVITHIIKKIKNPIDIPYYQLLMGQGKSSVIIPFLINTLSLEQIDNINIITLSPLIKQTWVNIRNTYGLIYNKAILDKIKIYADYEIKNEMLNNIDGLNNSKTLFLFDEIDEISNSLKSDFNLIESIKEPLIFDKRIEIIYNYFKSKKKLGSYVVSEDISIINEKDVNKFEDKIKDLDIDKQHLYRFLNRLIDVIDNVNNMQNRKHYGRDYRIKPIITKYNINIWKKSNIFRYFSIVPFDYIEKPSLKSEFTDINLLISLNCIAYINDKLTETDLDLLISYFHYRNNQQINKSSNSAISKFYELFKQPLNDIKNHKNINKYQYKLKDEKVIKFFLTKLLLPNIIKLKDKIKNFNYIDLLKNSSEYRFGMTGTPFISIPKNLNIDDQIYYTPLSSARNIAGILGYNQKEKPNFYFENSPDHIKNIIKILKENKHQVLIDTAGILYQMNSKDIATKLHELLNKPVFYIDNLDDYYIIRNNLHQKINTNRIDKDTFVYFDNAHITGIDLKLSDVRGLVTVNNKLTFRDLSQGIYRLRGLNVNQSIDYYGSFINVTQQMISSKYINNINNIYFNKIYNKYKEILLINMKGGSREDFINISQNIIKTFDGQEPNILWGIIRNTYFNNSKDQQDAGEFMIQFLNSMIEYQPDIKSKFSFNITTTTKCFDNSNPIDKIEEDIILKLHFPTNIEDSVILSLNELITNYQQEETADSKLEDRGCPEGETQHRQKITLSNFSDYLIINLVRNKFNADGSQTKIKNQIRIEQEIILEGNTYNLIGYSRHSGETVKEGHYLSIVKHNDSWIKISDYKKSNLAVLKNQDEPFILLYQKDDHNITNNMKEIKGLKNPSVSCYFNSSIQLLARTDMWGVIIEASKLPKPAETAEIPTLPTLSTELPKIPEIPEPVETIKLPKPAETIELPEPVEIPKPTELPIPVETIKLPKPAETIDLLKSLTPKITPVIVPKGEILKNLIIYNLLGLLMYNEINKFEKQDVKFKIQNILAIDRFKNIDKHLLKGELDVDLPEKNINHWIKNKVETIINDRGLKDVFEIDWDLYLNTGNISTNQEQDQDQEQEQEQEQEIIINDFRKVDFNINNVLIKAQLNPLDELKFSIDGEDIEYDTIKNKIYLVKYYNDNEYKIIEFEPLTNKYKVLTITIFLHNYNKDNIYYNLYGYNIKTGERDMDKKINIIIRIILKVRLLDDDIVELFNIFENILSQVKNKYLINYFIKNIVETTESLDSVIKSKSKDFDETINKQGKENSIIITKNTLIESILSNLYIKGDLLRTNFIILISKTTLESMINIIKRKTKSYYINNLNEMKKLFNINKDKYSSIMIYYFNYFDYKFTTTELLEILETIYNTLYK
jgi:hypothetical protein